MARFRLQRFGLPLLVAAALTGCVSISTSNRGDRRFEAGDYAAAAEAYEAILERGRAAGATEARALYRLALIHSRTGSELEDRRRAGELLERLLAEHPGSRYSAAARLILDLERQIARLRGEAEAAAARAAAASQRAGREKEELEGRIARVRGEADARDRRIRELEIELDRLRQRVSDLGEEIARREEELRRLKEIDLENPPS